MYSCEMLQSELIYGQMEGLALTVCCAIDRVFPEAKYSLRHELAAREAQYTTLLFRLTGIRTGWNWTNLFWIPPRTCPKARGK